MKTDLLVKHIANQTTTRETTQVEKWCAQSKENKADYDSLLQTWQHIETPAFEFPKEQGWQSIAQKIKSTESPSTFTPERSAPRFRFHSGFAWAGALVVIVLLVLFQAVPQYQTRTLITAKGEQISVQLPDGSTATLNAGSSLSFPKRFKTERRVELDGEAFFNVTKSSKPFIVCTGNAQVLVLGTLFNVWSRNNETRVAVESGTVSLSGMETDSTLVLQAGQAAIVENGNLPQYKPNANMDAYLDWLSGSLVFNQTTLSEIIGDLERQYNVYITTENINADTFTVTGSFTDMPIDEVLDTICLTLDLRCYQAAGMYTISN